MKKIWILMALLLLLVTLVSWGWKRHNTWHSPVTAQTEVMPRSIVAYEGGLPPSDAIILFNGKDLSAWEGAENWIVQGGIATANGGDIRTKAAFGDCQLHLEWRTPESKGPDDDKEQGNSGVLLMSRYEIQIIDSYGFKQIPSRLAGAVYHQRAPLVNVSRPPGCWQTFDIVFEAPTYEGDSLTRPGHVTVLHNGLVVQNHTEIREQTSLVNPVTTPFRSEWPLMLQGRFSKVAFRNIWIRKWH